MGDEQPNPSGRQVEGQSQSDIDILTTETGKSFLKYIVGMFAAVAGGYGLGVILLSIVEGNIGLVIGVFAFFIPIFGAPIIAMITGLYTGLGLNTTTKKALIVSSTGAFLGFFVLLVVLLFSASIAGDSGGGGGGGSGSISELFFPLTAFGLGVAATAAGATYIVRETDLANIQ